MFRDRLSLGICLPFTYMVKWSDRNGGDYTGSSFWNRESLCYLPWWISDVSGEHPTLRYWWILLGGLLHTEALSKGCVARYNLTRVELKTFTYAGGPQAISINNVVLGALPKRLIFTMVKNTDFLGSRNSNAYNLRHYDLTSFTMFMNGGQIPSESLSLNMGHEKTSVKGYATLFEGIGIHQDRKSVV